MTRADLIRLELRAQWHMRWAATVLAVVALIGAAVSAYAGVPFSVLLFGYCFVGNVSCIERGVRFERKLKTLLKEETNARHSD